MNGQGKKGRMAEVGDALNAGRKLTLEEQTQQGTDKVFQRPWMRQDARACEYKSQHSALVNG